MRWLAEVRVELRAGIADPEGLTIADGLRALGYEGVEQVRSGKLLRIAFDADDSEHADALVDEMCRRLLANPVMETARWELVADAEQDADEAIQTVTNNITTVIGAVIRDSTVHGEVDLTTHAVVGERADTAT